MPYPSEHAARLRDPGDFQADSFRRKELAPGVNAILGRLEGETTMTMQAVRFDKDAFSVDEAKAWCKENDMKPIAFEPAAEEEAAADAAKSIFLEQEAQAVRSAFQALFASSAEAVPSVIGTPYVMDVAKGFVIVDDKGKRFQVNYRGDQAKGYTFAPPEKWIPVEQVYVPLSVKAVGDYELEVLGVPFGGPNGGKDSDGEYFDAASKLHLDKYKTPIVTYYHGLDAKGKPQGEPEAIATAEVKRTDDRGVWYRIVLDRAVDVAKKLWEAAKNGTLFASSGSLKHLVRVARDGHIDNWPTAEIALIDAEGKRQPANKFAVALPAMKAAYQRGGQSLPDIEPERSEAEGEGSEQPDPEASSNGTTQTKARGAEMDEKELTAILDARDAKKAAEDKAAAEKKAAEDAAIKAAVDAALEKEREEAAKNRRLPEVGTPLKYGDAAYDHLDAGDMAVLTGVLSASGKRVSETAIKSLAAKLEGDKTGVGEMGRQAMKMAGIKANELSYSTYASYGDEWVGIAYSQAIWEAIRLGTFVVNKLPAVEIPQGMESMYLPLESTDPIFFKVAEATTYDSTLKIPAATITNSPVGSGRVLLALAKLGARVIWSGELDEGSLMPFVDQLRKQLVAAGGEYLESALIDGDTETSASTNINDIDGTPAATDWFMVWDGFRKSCLVTTSANSRSAGGSLDISDYLETVKLMGAAGKNGFDRSKVGFIVDLATHYKTSLLPEVLTRDVFVNPTVEGGILSGVFGYSLNPSGQICKNGGAGGLSEASGKCDETAADNAYGQILAVRWDQWKFGWRRRMTLETTRIANADATEIVALMRCGLIQRDTEASAITYYVGV
jgi:hypothetical protein